jgi:hypothetical protein
MFKTITTFLLLNSVLLLSQPSIIQKTTKNINFKVIETEISWFIKKIQTDSSVFIGKKVFVAVLNYNDSIHDDYCLTISYFQNDFSTFHYNHYKYLLLTDNEIVLLHFSNDFLKRFTLLDADRLRSIDFKSVKSKLLCDSAIIGTVPGAVCCFNNTSSDKIFYINSDDIPISKRNYPPN